MISIGGAIKGLLRDYGLEAGVRAHRAIVYWEDIVGPRMARHCCATRVKGATLYVRVTSAAWRNELALQKDEILRLVNDKIGSPDIKDIRFQ